MSDEAKVWSCPVCGEEASGPDKAGVVAVAQRHKAKTGHGAPKPATKRASK